jgi:hypothetical protein
MTMTLSRTLIAAALLSMSAINSASAQLPGWAGSYPDAFQAQYPDRDVLNGGALTPAGRMGLELPGGAASVFGTGNIGAASAYARLGAIPGHNGRRHGRE